MYDSKRRLGQVYHSGFFCPVPLRRDWALLRISCFREEHHRSATVDPRTINLHSIEILFDALDFVAVIRSNRNLAAAAPCSVIGWATVVSGGVVKAARGMLSKPAIATSSGTRIPSV
jgi:hypothetical protein